MITGTLQTTINRHSVDAKSTKQKKAFNFIKKKKTFLYIGNSSERTTKCLSFFDYSYNAINFELSKEYLKNEYKNENSLPDFIVVDCVYNEEKLSSFLTWLHTNKWSFMIPVLYNETALSSQQLSHLTQLGLMDDIVNLEEYCNQLYTKASFLRKAKSNNHISSKTQDMHKNYTWAFKQKKFNLPKRIFDLVLASTLLILVSPLFILIPILIAIESRGAVIYSSKRAGKGFKVFNFYKFRTMVADADEKIEELTELNLYRNSNNKFSFFKVKDDPRITRVGALLRNTSLDELPQLLNVIKGDMSIVGNRPLPLYEAKNLTTNEFSERFLAPAGITGLWQVTKRGNQEMSAEERISLDINYARNHSFLTDCKILFNTPLALIQKTNV